VIGEHTDYNQGLALAFAIDDGVTVRAVGRDEQDAGSECLEVLALNERESDLFPLREPGPASGWRAFVRGAAVELAAAGYPLAGGRLEIAGRVPQGAGLSSSAALTVSVCLALIELGSGERASEQIDRVELARLCSRVENEWTGAHTGLLDQLTSLCGASDTALCIDFLDLRIDRVPLELGGWRFAVAHSGERHANASSGYNQRREECARACELLGIDSLRAARPEQLDELPEPLARRARHVLEENDRVRETVAALQRGELERVGRLLSASHESLRDLYQVSTPTVEAAIERMMRSGAAGARLMGGGFGGSVLGLFAPGVEVPTGALVVHSGPGAHVLAR
jgi:galactokinase